MLYFANRRGETNNKEFFNSNISRLFKIQFNDYIFYFAFRSIFPLGLPEEFSFVSTFRKKNGRKDPWFLIRINDILGKPQFGISLNPRSQTLEFYALDFEGKLQIVKFSDVEVRKQIQHPIHFFN